jgi:hypothetical protein
MAYWNETTDERVYRVLVCGAEGTGKSSLLRSIALQLSNDENTPSSADDWDLRRLGNSTEAFEFIPVEMNVYSRPSKVNFFTVPLNEKLSMYRKFLLMGTDVIVYVARQFGDFSEKHWAVFQDICQQIEMIGEQPVHQVLFVNKSVEKSNTGEGFSLEKVSKKFRDQFLIECEGCLIKGTGALECLDAVQEILESSMPKVSNKSGISLRAFQNLQ